VTIRTPYTYAILRYRHDAVAGECLNVGVVMHSAENGLESRFNFESGRLQAAFPDLDRAAFKESLHAVERALVNTNNRSNDGSSFGSVGQACSSVLRDDDSSFIWSEAGSGIAIDLGAELEKLFCRFVTRSEHQPVPI
jgi:hypothetical protein